MHLQVEERNRTCGDQVTVFLDLSADGRASFRFTGAGCSLCIASASLMCTLLQNVDPDACQRELEHFQKVWKNGAAPGDAESWQVLDGLRQYPVRSRCVRLAWQALEKITEEWKSEHLGKNS